MMNKIKNLFLLALCAVLLCGAACGVSAQSGADKILIQGKTPLRQSEVDKLIEFYEWAFETRFTGSERERYRAFVVEGFRQDAATARQNTDGLIGSLAKVLAKDEEQQAKMRRNFNAGFVKDLRAASDDGSQLLLAVYERGQNGGGNSRSNGGKIREVLPSEEDLSDVEQSAPSSRGSRGAGSPKLVGKWTRSEGTGGADDGTGKTRYNSGTDTSFEFFADGTMSFTKDMQVLSITQCIITDVIKIPGIYSVSGDSVMMNLGMGIQVGTNSCDRAGNFKKKLSASTLTKTFVVKELDSVFRPDSPMILCMDGAADENCFERNPNK